MEAYNIEAGQACQARGGGGAQQVGRLDKLGGNPIYGS